MHAGMSEAIRPSPAAASLAAAPANGRLTPPDVPAAAKTFHGAVMEFKRRLIESALCEEGGNRTRAARALGLQRTYLLRLMREFGVNVPRGAGPAPPAGAR